MKDFINYTYTIIYDLAIWPLLLVTYLLWGEKLHWNKGPWFYFKKNSWPGRTWGKEWKGTTLGHGGFYGPLADKWTKFHEVGVHTEQYRANMLRHFMIALFIIGFMSAAQLLNLGLIMGGIVWFFGGLWSIPNWIVAYLQGEDIYKGSTHEESAYAQTTLASMGLNPDGTKRNENTK